MNIPTEALDIVTKLSELYNGVHDLLKDLRFDSISYQKKAQVQQKLAAGAFENPGTIYLGDTLKVARSVSPGRTYRHLPPGFFNSPDLTPEKNSIFILTNNDIGPALPNYIAYYKSRPDTLFIIWDWDSQHWIYMSCMLAMYSDFYVSGGSENGYLLSHFSSCVLGPVYGAVTQWTRQFITENMESIFMDRRDEPFGAHVFYQAYPRRNRVIATVNKVYPTVYFADNNYKNRTDLDNFREWCSYKTHWIIPVLGGIPTRAHNALITGGIPILPAYLKNFPEVALMGDTPLYYEVSDVIDPRSINEAAVDIFNSFDKAELEQRVLRALERNHLDGRLEHLLQLTRKEIIQIRTGDKSHKESYFTQLTHSP